MQLATEFGAPEGGSRVEGDMARTVQHPSDDPLMQGDRKTKGYSLPTTMRDFLEALSMREGFKSTSSYVAIHLLASIRQRLAEEPELDKFAREWLTKRGKPTKK